MAAVEKGPTSIWSVILASSAGTLIEWYDFYIFGSLATAMAAKFFPPGNETLALLSAFATFATGFIVRPFGAFFFGRLGDLLGRKHTFLVTLLLMGGSTFAIGVLPTYQMAGFLAPMLLVLLRAVQGLALGGEYGGAATYVAEHAPEDKRGYYTSYIQTTATLGLFLSILVIMGVKGTMSKESFEEFGWRVPFLLSVFLIGLSYVIRRKMAESPLFTKLKSEGKTSTNPLFDSFGHKANRRVVLLALFGATMGQGVVWYTGQFYALFFMQKVLMLPDAVAYQVILVALALATPLFIFHGALSDRIGRKRVMLTGIGLGALLFLPLYAGMTMAAGFDPIAKAAVNPNVPLLTLLVFIQVVLVTMAYGPIAAFLVDIFPTKIRYTSMSVPYHIGNGIFGGLVPLINTWIVAATGNMYAGLAYPIIVAAITGVVGWLSLPEKVRDEEIVGDVA